MDFNEAVAVVKRQYRAAVLQYVHPVKAARAALRRTWPLIDSGISSATHGNRGSPERKFAAQLLRVAYRNCGPAAFWTGDLCLDCEGVVDRAGLICTGCLDVRVSKRVAAEVRGIACLTAVAA